MITITKDNPQQMDALFRGATLPDLPSTIHINGSDMLVREPGRLRVAIIGTRDASPYGKQMTELIVNMLSQNPAKPVIISGLAMGIDTEAHRSALTNGLATVAVMATGPETVYPYCNRRLAQEIAESGEGCLLTEFPEGTAPMAINFLVRNRTIAALSDIVIVIESKTKGGAMVTARYAWDMGGKTVYAVPGRIDDIRSQGCNELIATGVARMLCRIGDLKDIKP